MRFGRLLERCTSHPVEGGWVESKLYVGMVLVVFGRWLGEGVFLYCEECQACFFGKSGYCAVLCDGNACFFENKGLFGLFCRGVLGGIEKKNDFIIIRYTV